MIKRGDTLIEVTLAVGIFSMVAIAIVAVVNGSTSSAQTALESTLARNEIDAQAEALRFINSSYIAEKGTAQQDYQKLWSEITNAAVDPEEQSAILTYAPTSCAELYDSKTGEVQNAFIINHRALGKKSTVNASSLTSPIIKASGNKNAFSAATTYPRLVYKDEQQSILSASSSNFTNFYKAEGIYVIAVKEGSGQTKMQNRDNKTPAFYDFYIRTCWYGAGAEEPSTISTVIRLYEPKVLK